MSRLIAVFRQRAADFLGSILIEPLRRGERPLAACAVSVATPSSSTSARRSRMPMPSRCLPVGRAMIISRTPRWASLLGRSGYRSWSGKHSGAALAASIDNSRFESRGSQIIFCDLESPGDA
jgi:hypothetical protein